MFEKLKTNLTDFLAKEDATYNIILLIINPILFSLVPIIWFLIFMKEKMIFSYDFFTNGMFGLSVFFFISLLLLALLGFLLVGSIAFFSYYFSSKFLRNKNNKPFSKKEFSEPLYIGSILLLINIVFAVMYFLGIKTNLQSDIFVFIISFGFFSFLHIGISIGARGIFKFISLFVFIVVFIWLSIGYHSVTSSFIETGLLKFRMGGDIKTRVIDFKENKTMSEGKLILLTPNRIFLQENNKTKIFNRNNTIIEFLNSNDT